MHDPGHNHIHLNFYPSPILDLLRSSIVASLPLDSDGYLNPGICSCSNYYLD